MSPPALKGLHHVKLPVSDLDASTAWYGGVLGAERQPRFDHFDAAHVRYAVILAVPGSPVPLELRWAPRAVRAIVGYDPVSFAVEETDLPRWLEHLDRHQVAHSGITRAAAGHLVVFADPDGTFLRLLTVPAGGVAATTLDQGVADPEDRWTSPEVMRHPGAGGQA